MSDTTENADDDDDLPGEPATDVPPEQGGLPSEAGGELPEDMEGVDAQTIMSAVGGGGLQDVLMRETFPAPDGSSYSIAELVADVINVMRLDAKQMGALHDVDISVNKMSEQRAAELVEAVVLQRHADLLDVFTDIEDKRDRIFEELMDDGQHGEFLNMKTKMLMTVNAEEYDPDVGGGS